MNYLEISISTTSDVIDAVAAALTSHGFADLVLEDEQDLASFLEENRKYWDYIDESLQSHLQGLSRIKLYLEEADEEGLCRLNALLASLRAQGLGALPMEASPLAEANWEESWKENYPPQRVGEKLIVLPYWLADTDTEGRLPIVLDPGLTFGTGAHPSTQMVLEAMEKTVKEGASCLDLGSGSGILSIAALRLGAASAIGIDIDQKAEDIARENAAYNGFASPRFTALTGNVLTDKALMTRLKKNRYDVVLINIVADVIVALSPVLPEFMDEESLLICSGILENHLDDVKNALQSAGLTVTALYEKEEWRCVCAKRRRV